MSHKDLYGVEAIQKLNKIANGIDYCMLVTDQNARPFHAVPMSTKKVDEEGTVWFLSGKDSTHNQNIAKDSRVHLIYSSPSSMEFLTVFGEARLLTDKVILEELYQKTDDAWFDGLDDPNLTAISVHPTEVFYWDPKHGKLVSLAKMGVGALTGEPADVMDEGRLDV